MSLSIPFDRRGFLKLAGLSWLTPVGQLLADQAEKTRRPAQSVILLWLGGGPSQLETFDPHPGKHIAGGISFGCKRGDEDNPFGGDKGLVRNLAAFALGGLPRLAPRLRDGVRRFSDRNEAERKRGRALAAKPDRHVDLSKLAGLFEGGDQVKGLAVRAEPRAFFPPARTTMSPPAAERTISPQQARA